MRGMSTVCLPVLIFLAGSAHALTPETDPWGLCPATPAVVHPVALSPLQEVISLRGEWDFVTDASLMGRHRMGKGPGWNEPDWKGVRKIQVPGCWEAQGVGEPGMSHDWGLAFDCIPRPLRNVYMGVARYRRTVELPEAWAGKRVWLKVGGVRTEAWLWVNQQRVAHLNTYCGTYKYDITDFVKPGESAEIVATVRNDTPSRKGCMAAFHRFGGFYRDIELEATPQTRLDDVWVRGDLDKKTVSVHVSLRHADATAPTNLAVKIGIKTLDGKSAGAMQQDVTLDATGAADVVCEIPLTDVRPWSPETPNLYLADVTLLAGDTPIHGWVERFGIRKIEVRGNRIFLNNQPFFARGYGDDYIYPLTLISPPDREEHLRHLQIARRAGFNFIRHHTHCEIPEFFEAADEAGILLQPELPYYHDITPEGFEFDPQRDIEELYRHYRRYASFGAYSTGNEGYLGSPIDAALYQWVKRTDPDRIMQHQDGGCNTPENSDFCTPNGYGIGSSINPWAKGAFDQLDRPFIAHEYLNLGIKMDPRIAPRFTGAIPSPRSLEDYEASLRDAGLDRPWGDACLDAAHALQGYYQKEGIEAARRDPACDGYFYWTIVDVMVAQGPTFTGQGFLNAFWEQKSGGLSLDAFRCFNGATVLLAELDPESAIAVSGDTCSASVSLSHFGSVPLRQARVSWKLTAGTKTLASGQFEPVDAAPGDVKEIGACTFAVPELDTPVQATFEAVLEGLDVSNAWDLWLFPKRDAKSGAGLAATEDLFDTLAACYPDIAKAGTPEAATAEVVIGSWDHPELIAATDQGMRGLMIGPADGDPNVRLGWWSLGDQLGTAFAKHPVFGDFPHNGKLSPLWFRLIKRGIPLPIPPEFGTFTHFAVGEGLDNYFSYVCQKQGPQGQRLLVTRGVDLLADTPEGAWLLDNMIAYVKSEAFLRPTEK